MAALLLIILGIVAATYELEMRKNIAAIDHRQTVSSSNLQTLETAKNALQKIIAIGSSGGGAALPIQDKSLPVLAMASQDQRQSVIKSYEKNLRYVIII